MANLIITVIAIALVAVASLMGAYYGGSAFLNNQSAAEASTILNQGQQIAGAWQAYLGDNLNSVPTDVNSLVTSNYMQSTPQYPAGAGGALAPAAPVAVVSIGTHYYAISGVGKSTAAATDPNGTACTRIVKTATGTAPTNPGTPATYTAMVASPTLYGNATFGCALPVATTGGTLITNSGATTAMPTPGAAGTGFYTAYYLLS